MSPIVAGLGQGALYGGLSAYGNLAEENDRNKGDQRMILESTLAALGGGAAAYAARRAMNGRAAGLVRSAATWGSRVSPRRFAAMRDFYQGNPVLNRLSPETWMNLAATGLAAGAGASIGGGGVAPFLSNQFGLMQMPGSWTQRANDWNWDRQTAINAQIAEEILARLQ